MTLPELCIRRPVMTTLLMMSFVVNGLFGYRQLPVATLLERQFETIAGIDSITSTSGQGSTQITIQFDLSRDIDGAALDVQSALTTAARQLPPEMTTPPSFRKVNPADQPVLFLALS